MSRPVAVSLALLLALPLLLASCLHWVDPEELEPDDDDTTEADDDDSTEPDDDDSTGPDDDDVVPDDDDVQPPDPYAADAIGLLLVMDDLDGQATGELIAGALFDDAVMSPSAEEALVEELFFGSWPLFAEPGEVRLLEAGDYYDVTGLNVGAPLFLNSGTASSSLSWSAPGYLPMAGVTLPDLETGDVDWTLQVPAGDSGFGGFHAGPALPEAAKPFFPRTVGDRVHLLAGEQLTGHSDSTAEATDLLVLRSDETGPALAWAPQDDGTATLPWEALPDLMLEMGRADLSWYRALRAGHDLDGGRLLLVSGRWTQLELRILPPDVAYAWSEPPVLPAGSALKFVVRLEGITIDGDAIPQVYIADLQAPEVEVISDDEIFVVFPGGLSGVGLYDLWVDWPGGQALGTVQLTLEELPCDLTESEPNDMPSQAHFFMPGLVACGTTDPMTDVDNYRFNAAVGSTYTFETLANRLGYPTDTTLRVLDMSGNELAFSDDDAGMWDSLIIWTPEAGGQHLVRVESYNNQVGGPGHDYQLITGVE